VIASATLSYVNLTQYANTLAVECNYLLLTGLSLMNQVNLAAGLDQNEVQFPWRVSSARYRWRIPDITGLSRGVSVTVT